MEKFIWYSLVLALIMSSGKKITGTEVPLYCLSQDRVDTLFLVFPLNTVENLEHNMVCKEDSQM